MYKWLYLGVVIVASILLTLVIVNSISYGRTDAWLIRAKDAGNPAQVAEFLANYKISLEDRNLVEGKYYTIWKYPATDMNTYTKIIDGLIVRAEALSQQDATAESYQMGLINLEKDLGDIDVRAFSVWFAQGGFWLVSFSVILGTWAGLGWMPFIL